MPGSFGTRRLVARYDSGLIGGTWSLAAPLLEDPDRRLPRPVLGRHVELVPLALPLRLALDAAARSSSAARSRRTSPTTACPRASSTAGSRATRTAIAASTRSPTRASWTSSCSRTSSSSTTCRSAPGRTSSQTFYAFRGDGSYEQLRLGSGRSPSTTCRTWCLPDGTTIEESDLVRRRTVGEWDYGWVPTLSHRRGPFTLTVSGELRLHDAHHTGEVKWAQYYPVGVAPDHRYYDYRVDKHTGDRRGPARLGGEPAAHAVGRAAAHARARTRCREDRIKGVSLDAGLRLRPAAPRGGRPPRARTPTRTSTSRAACARRTSGRSTIPQDYYSVPATGARPEDVDRLRGRRSRSGAAPGGRA